MLWHDDPMIQVLLHPVGTVTFVAKKVRLDTPMPYLTLSSYVNHYFTWLERKSNIALMNLKLAILTDKGGAALTNLES